MKNQYVVPVVIAVVVGGVSFFGGLTYQKSQDSLTGVAPQDLSAKLKSLGFAGAGGGGAAGAAGAGFFAGRGGAGAAGRRGGGGLVTGQILSKDDTSITVKLTDGSTKTAYFSGSTTIGMIATGTSSDLVVGKQVTVTGTTSSDGSVAATNIQIRPAATPTP